MNNTNSFKNLFGPVHSRRLGMSLGVDLVPYKMCSFDCCYCECGLTTTSTDQRREYIPAHELIDEISLFLKNARSPIDILTFTGSGEPTLNTALGEVVRFVKKKYPHLKTALLTNSSMLHKKEVIDDILTIDYLLPTFNAVSDEAFQKINNPSQNITSLLVMKGLQNLSSQYTNNLWIELFIVPGINDTTHEVSLIKDFLLSIHLNRVQLNSLDRPGSHQWVKPAPLETLTAIANQLMPLPIEIISRLAKQNMLHTNFLENTEGVIAALKRRPMTLEDLSVCFHTTINSMQYLMDSLLSQNQVIMRLVNQQQFYCIKERC